MLHVQAKEEGKESAEPVEPVMRTVSKSSEEWQIQNDSKPLWTKPPKEVCCSPTSGLPLAAAIWPVLLQQSVVAC